jgi:hypothetical protein
LILYISLLFSFPPSDAIPYTPHTPTQPQRMALPEDHPDVASVWLEVYKSFVEAVDGNDNGVNQYESDKPPRWGACGDV